MRRLHERETDRNVTPFKNTVEDIACAGTGTHGFNGPMKTLSKGGAQYVLKLVDD